MKITIRSRYINTFLVGFRAFSALYPDEIKNLVVIVDQDQDTPSFLAAGDYYGFEVVIVPRTRMMLYDNNYASILYASLQYEEVVSLDDDVIFLRPGFFERLKSIREFSDAKIIGTKYFPSKGGEVLHSPMIYIKDVKITEKDFASTAYNMDHFDGIDTAVMGINHKAELFFIEDILASYQDPNRRGTYSNEYFVHVGGPSCMWHRVSQHLQVKLQEFQEKSGIFTKEYQQSNHK